MACGASLIRKSEQASPALEAGLAASHASVPGATSQ